MGRGFSHNGKTLLSGIDPAGKARRIAETAPVLDRTLYFCPSPLYGYGLECLLSRMAPSSALLCIEADPALFALSQQHFTEELKSNRRLYLTDQCDTGTLCALLRQEWGLRSFRRVEVVHLNGGWQLFPELYNTLAESLRREIAITWGNAMTLARLGRRYTCNAIRNLALLPHHPSLGQLSFGADPVLVLGAGPSLDQLLDSLLAHYGTAVQMPLTRTFRIICVDTCLPSLRERGIQPDLAIVLESQHWNLEDFVGLSGWNIPTAMDLSALPRSGSVLGGELFIFFTPWTKMTIFERLDAAGLLPAPLPPLGSVGLSAVLVAQQLTRGTIISAGLDFSFTLDSFHARSTPGHKRKLRSHNRLHSLLNAEMAFGRTVSGAVSKTGNQVYSSLALRNYRDLFEREFGAVMGSSARQMHDIASNGLPLGLETLSPEAAIAALKGGPLTPATHGVVAPSSISAQLRTFMRGEYDRLLLLRGALTGEIFMDYDTLFALIHECDYLWAHFPDYAAAEHGPARAELEAGTGAAISFLKRLRVEIDPFLKLWELSLKNT